MLTHVSVLTMRKRKLQEKSERKEFRIKVKKNLDFFDKEECFSCPSCKAKICPDNEESYQILDVNGECGARVIYEVTLQCSKCKTKIILDWRNYNE